MTFPSLLPSIWGRRDQNGDTFRSLQHEVDRVFDEFTRGFRIPELASENDLARFSPRLDVTETKDAIKIDVDIPGMEEKDIELTVADKVLSIKGERRTESEDETEGRHVIERSYGAFQRSIPLPFDLDEKKVDARYDHGVLKIVLPKPPEVAARTRKIPVKVCR